MAKDSNSGTLELPVFESGKSYILKGETLQQIVNVIKENRVVLTGDVSYSEAGPDGSKLPLSKLTLAVCINGVSQLRTFVTVAD